MKTHNIGFVYDDISDFDFSASLEKKQYQIFIDDIDKYLQEQEMHRKRLVNFVLSTELEE